MGTYGVRWISSALKKSEAGSKLSDLSKQSPLQAAHSAEGAPGRLVGRTPGCSGGEYLTSTLPQHQELTPGQGPKVFSDYRLISTR